MTFPHLNSNASGFLPPSSAPQQQPPGGAAHTQQAAMPVYPPSAVPPSFLPPPFFGSSVPGYPPPGGYYFTQRPPMPAYYAAPFNPYAMPAYYAAPFNPYAMPACYAAPFNPYAWPAYYAAPFNPHAMPASASEPVPPTSPHRHLPVPPMPASQALASTTLGAGATQQPTQRSPAPAIAQPKNAKAESDRLRYHKLVGSIMELNTKEEDLFGPEPFDLIIKEVKRLASTIYTNSLEKKPRISLSMSSIKDITSIAAQHPTGGDEKTEAFFKAIVEKLESYQAAIRKEFNRHPEQLKCCAQSTNKQWSITREGAQMAPTAPLTDDQEREQQSKAFQSAMQSFCENVLPHFAKSEHDFLCTTMTTLLLALCAERSSLDVSKQDHSTRSPPIKIKEYHKKFIKACGSIAGEGSETLQTLIYGIFSQYNASRHTLNHYPATKKRKAEEEAGPDLPNKH